MISTSMAMTMKDHHGCGRNEHQLNDRAEARNDDSNHSSPHGTGEERDGGEDQEHPESHIPPAPPLRIEEEQRPGVDK